MFTKQRNSRAGALAAICLIATALATMRAYSGETKAPGRGQWTPEEAWAWHRKVGVIRGFNAMMPGEPGMSRRDVARRASAIGYNSVRSGVIYPQWKASPEKAKQNVRELLDDLQAFGMTAAMTIGYDSKLTGDEKNWPLFKEFVQDIIGTFRADNRIVLWDLKNEAAFRKEEMHDLRLVKAAFEWAREMSPTQPLTVSAYFFHGHATEKTSERAEVMAMADVHNFHLYDCSREQMQGIEDMVAALKKISDRPIVCTECLARPRGDSFSRILPAFSKHQIHWYNWGLHACDAHWGVSWKISTFDPYEPWFHDVLHPDGTPYDWREVEMIRNFRFAKPGEETDPGVEVTDRWLKERAWKWVNIGPVRGCTYLPKTESPPAAMQADLARLQAAGCDSLRVPLDYAAWKENPQQFRKRVDAILACANRHGMTVMPVLLTDADGEHPVEELAKYVSATVKAFGRDPRIYGWDLYSRPGGTGLARDKAEALLREAFRAARFEFPGQPLTATPAVRVEKFPADFDYRASLGHQTGGGGWNKIKGQGTADPKLCAYVWRLSDVLAFPSDMGMPETGWLLSVANRYGRPVLCTEWSPPDDASAQETLKHFAAHHVRWYAASSTAFDSEPLARLVTQFKFTRTISPRK